MKKSPPAELTTRRVPTLAKIQLTLWLVSIDNGEEFEDYDSTPVAVCHTEDDAQKLKARIEAWSATRPSDATAGAGDIARWLGTWPLPPGQAPLNAVFDKGKVWIIELPKWSPLPSGSGASRND